LKNVFLKHEIFENLFLDCLAHLVLSNDGRTNYGDVAVFGYLNHARIVVSILFCYGKNMGKMYFIFLWFLL
jgi:hypothetical protein